MTSPLRIVSWNIQHGGGKRADAVLSQLERWGPDCVVLVEYRGTDPSRRIGRGLGELGLTHQVDCLDAERRAANAVLVAARFPLEPLPAFGLLADLQRWVGVRVAAPVPFLLFGMHVPNRGEGPKYDFHEAVAQELEARRDQLGVAVGDTNTGRRGIDETTRFFNRAEDAWFDRMAEAGWSDIYRTRHPDERVASWYSQQGGGFRLDQAFVTEAMTRRVRSVRYDWGDPARPSDHAAMVLDVDLVA